MKKLSKKEFNNYVFQLFENANYQDYCDSKYQSTLYLQKEYKEKFGIELDFNKIGDEVMKKLGINSEKWDEITFEIFQKEKKKALRKIEQKIIDFAESARILGFSFDFDLAECVGEEAEKIAAHLLN